jgi:hypothetical protein
MTQSQIEMKQKVQDAWAVTAAQERFKKEADQVALLAAIIIAGRFAETDTIKREDQAEIDWAVGMARKIIATAHNER